MEKNEWRFREIRDILKHTTQFETLFCGTIKAYLRSKEPKWFAKCDENEMQCHLMFAENSPNDKKDILFLQYFFSEKTRVPVIYGDGFIDTLHCLPTINVLYSRLKKDYAILHIKDLQEEKSRYELKSFLIRNHLQVKDAKQLFQYLYRVYGQNDLLGEEGEVCGFPFFYSIHDFKKIPLEFGRYSYLGSERKFYRYKTHNAYNAYFRGKIRTVLEEYQKEANNYFCGAILGFNERRGQWKLYFFVVNDTNPIDYKVYVFETPPNKDCIVNPLGFY